MAGNCAAKKVHHVSHFFVQMYKIYLYIFLSVKASFDAFEVLRLFSSPFYLSDHGTPAVWVSFSGDITFHSSSSSVCLEQVLSSAYCFTVYFIALLQFRHKWNTFTKHCNNLKSIKALFPSVLLNVTIVPYFCQPIMSHIFPLVSFKLLILESIHPNLASV